MTTTPQAALLREAAQNALITLDGIASANPRDKADFETPDEWIAWAKSRARFAADALRAPVAQEVYAERILRQMLHESDQTQSMQVEPALTEEEIWFIASDGMRSAAGGIYQSSVIEFARAVEQAAIAKLQATQAEPVQAGELPDEREAFKSWMRENTRYGIFSSYGELGWSVWQAATARAAIAESQAKQVTPSTFALQALVNMLDMAYQVQQNDEMAIVFEPETKARIAEAKAELAALSARKPWKRLDDDAVIRVWAEAGGTRHGFVPLLNAAVAEFCRINGIGLEVKP